MLDISRATYAGQVLEAISQDIVAHQGHKDADALTCLGMAYQIITGDEFTGNDLMSALGYCIVAEHLSSDQPDMLRVIGPLTDWAMLEIQEATKGGPDRVIN